MLTYELHNDALHRLTVFLDEIDDGKCWVGVIKFNEETKKLYGQYDTQEATDSDPISLSDLRAQLAERDMRLKPLLKKGLDKVRISIGRTIRDRQCHRSLATKLRRLETRAKKLLGKVEDVEELQ